MDGALELGIGVALTKRARQKGSLSCQDSLTHCVGLGRGRWALSHEENICLHLLWVSGGVLQRSEPFVGSGGAGLTGGLGTARAQSGVRPGSSGAAGGEPSTEHLPFLWQSLL